MNEINRKYGFHNKRKKNKNRHKSIWTKIKHDIILYLREKKHIQYREMFKVLWINKLINLKFRNEKLSIIKHKDKRTALIYNSKYSIIIFSITKQ